MKSKADNIFEKELWCLNYIKLLHEITSAKFDEITSYLAIVFKYFLLYLNLK